MILCASIQKRRRLDVQCAKVFTENKSVFPSLYSIAQDLCTGSSIFYQYAIHFIQIFFDGCIGTGAMVSLVESTVPLSEKLLVVHDLEPHGPIW